MSETTTNRLAGAASPYLRSAAHQPVDWHEWGPEAFARARELNRPVLLDIGAVWCHWCHVMDRESYESPEVARLINEHFVAIKVDRDERPDIDARYQAAVSAMSGQGGWPLTAFLTADGRPFFGGTYFPPEDLYGRVGFKRVLTSIASSYLSRQPEIRESADKLVAALRQAEMFAGARRAFSPEIVDQLLHACVRQFDVRFGGFGNAPKFPHPTAVELLLEAYQSSGERYLETVLKTTLTGMARGGVYDHLAGGFHRYSVDDRWHVPHFEKMSYDNSELLKNYLHGYQVFGDRSYRQVAESMIGWVFSTLADNERGGFYASQDADYSLEDDGDYFTWTLAEARDALTPEEVELVTAHFDLREQGPMHHNPAKNVLQLAQTAEELASKRGQPAEEIEKRLAEAREKMRAARLRRPTPYVDQTIYVAWNAMFVSAFLEAARVLGREDCRAHALRTLDRVLDTSWSELWGFGHRCPEQGKVAEQDWAGGVLDDQVFMAAALLDAFELTSDKRYFDRAQQTMQLCLKNFWDEADGGCFDRPTTAPGIAEGVDVPRKPFQDSPTPAANPVAAIVLDRLASYTHDPDYRDRAMKTLEAFAGAADQYGLFAATYALAAMLHIRQPLEVVVIGVRSDARTQALVRAAQGTYRFGKAVLQYEPGEVSPDRLPPGLAATLPAVAGNERPPHALLCMNQTCQPPLTSPEELTAALAGASK